MTPENFCYWLQGHLEIGGVKKLTAEEVQVIQDHLNLVFKKETPVRQPQGLKNVFGGIEVYHTDGYYPNRGLVQPAHDDGLAVSWGPQASC